MTVNMKEQIEFQGKTFKFKDWRVKPNTMLPAEYRDGQHMLDPEAIYGSDDGDEFGFHPKNSLLIKP